MGRMTLRLPRLGETMEEAKVVDWLVAPGAAFARGDVLLEVETDKTVVEVPALMAGVMQAHLVASGDTVALDQPIAEVEVEGEVETAPASVPAAAPEAVVVPSVMAAPIASGPRPAASPAARAAARAAGVALTLVQGTGRRGRIQAADVAGAQTSAVTLVLLHGLFDDSTGWRDLPRRLRAAGHPVVTLDLPGHGTTPMAQDVEAALQQIMAALPAGPLRLIGHSLGAALAVKLAVRVGGRVEGLVLSAPAGLGPRINADFLEGMRQAETPAALARALALLGAGPVSETALVAEVVRLRGLRAGHGVLAEAAARGGIQQIDIAGDLARLHCPVTVLFGTEDRILNWQDVAHLPPHVAIHLIRGAGHLPHLAAPDLFLGLIGLPPHRRSAHA